MAINKSARDYVVFFSVIAAVVVLVMANLLADRKFVRADLTKERRYSLSEPFQDILSRIKPTDTARVNYYVSSEIPSWFVSRKRDILDRLNEIQIASGGRIEIEPVDPTNNPELRERLAQAGGEFELPDVSKDSTKMIRVYSALEITYQDKPKVLIPGVGDARDLEYLLGSKIMELTLEKKPIVAVNAPQGNPQRMAMMGEQGGSGFEWLQQGIWDDAKKFDIRSCEISEQNPIPKETALLVLIRPDKLAERQQYEVIKYLAEGGKVLLLASPFKVAHVLTWRAEATPTGLEDYLKESGLTFGADFICDNSNLRLIKSINPFTKKFEYSKNPFFIKILAQNIDQTSPLTRLMPGFGMPSPSEIILDDAKLKKDGVKYSVLAKTSAQSWIVPFRETVNPDLEALYDEDAKQYSGSKNVFVMLTGQFPFPFEGKKVPAWTKPGQSKIEQKMEESESDKKPELAKATLKPGTLLVCSAPEAFHSMYLEDQTVGAFMRNNASLLVNIAESVSLGDDLIKLRAKHYEARTIKQFPGAENDRKRNVIKLALIGGVPLLVVLLALLRALLRRVTQNSYERKFAQTSGPSSFTP